MSRSWPALALIVAIGICGFSWPALAQTSLDAPLDARSAQRLDRLEKAFKELRAIVFQGRESGQPVVVQPADTGAQILSLTDKISELSQMVSRLNGQMEVIGHDLDQSRRETADLKGENAALRQQVQALAESVRGVSAPAPIAPAGGAAADPAETGEPTSVIAKARADIAAGRFDEAETALHAFIADAGETPAAAEARYWLAKSLIGRRDWSAAASADIAALRGWPKTRWAPDAVLDLARALNAMDKRDDACQALDELARRFPKLTPTVAKGAAGLRARAHCG